MRNTRIVVLLKAALHGVDNVYSSYNTNRTTNLYNLGINSQVCYLEKVLNDKFDPNARKIYIDDYSANGTLSYIYWEKNLDNDESKLLNVYSESVDATTLKKTKLLCSEEALATGVTTFKVMIKSTQNAGEVDSVVSYLNNSSHSSQSSQNSKYVQNYQNYRQFCAYLDNNKLAGKQYKIIVYS